VKTNTRVLGVVENMSWFVCPSCKCETKIFPPVTGGAKKMCEDWKLDLLGQIPIDVQLLLSTEKGSSICEDAPDSHSSLAYNTVVDGNFLLIPIYLLIIENLKVCLINLENLCTRKNCPSELIIIKINCSLLISFFFFEYSKK
jgi:hypothetical protein